MVESPQNIEDNFRSPILNTVKGFSKEQINHLMWHDLNNGLAIINVKLGLCLPTEELVELSKANLTYVKSPPALKPLMFNVLFDTILEVVNRYNERIPPDLQQQLPAFSRIRKLLLTSHNFLEDPQPLIFQQLHDLSINFSDLTTALGVEKPVGENSRLNGAEAIIIYNLLQNASKFGRSHVMSRCEFGGRRISIENHSPYPLPEEFSHFSTISTDGITHCGLFIAKLYADLEALKIYPTQRYISNRNWIINFSVIRKSINTQEDAVFTGYTLKKLMEL